MSQRAAQQIARPLMADYWAAHYGRVLLCEHEPEPERRTWSRCIATGCRRITWAEGGGLCSSHQCQESICCHIPKLAGQDVCWFHRQANEALRATRFEPTAFVPKTWREPEEYPRAPRVPRRTIEQIERDWERRETDRRALRELDRKLSAERAAKGQGVPLDVEAGAVVWIAHNRWSVGGTVVQAETRALAIRLAGGTL